MGDIYLAIYLCGLILVKSSGKVLIRETENLIEKILILQKTALGCCKLH